MAQSEFAFKVRRREPELIAPAGPTPREIKRLSDVDDQDGLRSHMPLIHFYRNAPRPEDPAAVIRGALAKALVYYYPLAGRLREERPSRKLVVDCTGEMGVVFVEADADVALEDFGDALRPPFPCLGELLYEPQGSGDVLTAPLLLIQVTRLTCKGFIFTLNYNHVMSDGIGVEQFMTAVAELARGAAVPSVLPVWERHLLNARNPPRVSFVHREYDRLPDAKGTTNPLEGMAHRSFFLGPTEISALRSLAEPNSNHYSTFEILTACFWRARTAALQPDPDEEMRVMCAVNARSKFNPPLPQGYYGNVIAFPMAIAAARDLIAKPLGFAVELVRRAKEEVTEEYMRSLADFMVVKGRPPLAMGRTYRVSDSRRMEFKDVDFGWGKAVYGGPAKGTVTCFYIPFRNREGEDGFFATFYLPAPAMERFVVELDAMLRGQGDGDSGESDGIIVSAL